MTYSQRACKPRYRTVFLPKFVLKVPCLATVHPRQISCNKSKVNSRQPHTKQRVFSPFSQEWLAGPGRLSMGECENSIRPNFVIAQSTATVITRFERVPSNAIFMIGYALVEVPWLT